MDPRAAVSRGRAFVKGVVWSLFSYLDALGENSLFFPEAQDVFFQLRKFDLSIYFLKHS
jgi:hypothetical protein